MRRCRLWPGKGFACIAPRVVGTGRLYTHVASGVVALASTDTAKSTLSHDVPPLLKHPSFTPKLRVKSCHAHGDVPRAGANSIALVTLRMSHVPARLADSESDGGVLSGASCPARILHFCCRSQVRGCRDPSSFVPSQRLSRVLRPLSGSLARLVAWRY